MPKSKKPRCGWQGLHYFRHEASTRSLCGGVQRTETPLVIKPPEPCTRCIELGFPPQAKAVRFSTELYQVARELAKDWRKLGPDASYGLLANHLSDLFTKYGVEP